jgi:putative N6-adenine-specific DNA methylase
VILIATCPEETKEILINELQKLGAKNIVPGYMSVEFEVNERQFYKAHLVLRTASQLHLKIKKVSSNNKVILNSQAKRIKWEEIFDVRKTYRIDAITGERGEEFMTSNEISKTVRLSLEDRFNHKLGEVPKVELKDPDVIINAYQYKGKAILSVNTSGLTLHKRGYKNDNHPAPMKETLASAILDITNYTGEEALYDPMCGSGTIVIEAAMKAINKGANIHRKKGNFAFEDLKMFDSKLYRDIQDEVRKDKIEEPWAPIFASDINESFVTSAKDNALRARVEKHIDFKSGSFFDFEKPSAKGIIITNLPYGDRIGPGEQQEMEEFYSQIGDHLKKNYSGWKAALFVSEDAPWKKIGLRPSKRFNLKNGSIKTKLLVYEMYEGSKKAKKQ